MVSGTRDGRKDVEASLDAWAEVFGRPYVIVGGDLKKGKRSQRGVDKQAYEWAVARGFHGTIVYADWDKFGVSAGPRRNARMVRKAERPDHWMGFPGPWSKGTPDCFRQARSWGLLAVFVEREWLKELMRMTDDYERAMHGRVGQGG